MALHVIIGVAHGVSSSKYIIMIDNFIISKDDGVELSEDYNYSERHTSLDSALLITGDSKRDHGFARFRLHPNSEKLGIIKVFL
ncbi:unnamed protein product [Macrosiphum euphorbiae]|uniref:Uncharacterized protein n=1 Tax=Macrosiphum euphorbiae TaxID=13131 RepID=A0AAV0XVR5_9HEMI|nr:unnamed protein product [Macrosiphum euphorbiae]